MSGLWSLFLLALLAFVVTVVLALRGIGLGTRSSDDKGANE
ncbi:hypothetical protein [Piscinibacter sp.]|nr:hypothetical protein [Piscinibacter sp.]